MLRLSVFMVVLSMLLGCDQILRHRINSFDCNTNNCKIRLKDFTNFKWDKLYVFNFYCNSDIIDSVLGQPYHQKYNDFSKKQIYLYNEKIVHVDEVENMISEPPQKGEYIICIPSRLVYLEFNPNNAIFRLSHVGTRGGVYSELKYIVDSNFLFYFGAYDYKLSNRMPSTEISRFENAE